MSDRKTGEGNMKRSRQIRRLQAVVVIGLLAVASGALQAAGALSPCDLITKEEVEAIVGEPVSLPEYKDARNPLGQKMCQYNTVSASRLIQISVIRTSDMLPKVREGGQSAESIYQTTKTAITPLEEVKGIGDDAFWATPGLHILQGNAYVVVSVGNTGKRENLELARKIAGKVMSRLGS
jgi:hypothetical protein